MRSADSGGVIVDQLLGYSSLADGGQIAQRYDDGRLRVGDAVDGADAVPKNQLDTALAGKVGTTDGRLTDEREPLDNSVTSAKIVDGAITNADINASAAIVATKLAAAVQASLGKADSAVQNVSGATGMWVGSTLPGSGTTGVLYVVT